MRNQKSRDCHARSRSALAMTGFTAIMLLVAACGGGSETSGSDDDSSPSTGSGNNGSGGNGAGSSTSSGNSSGGSGVCHPSINNGWCANADSCECLPTLFSDQEWCDEIMTNYGVNVCNPEANYCTPGHNRCGYELPLNMDYQMPGECAYYVYGDTWVDETGEFDFTIGSSLNENGQTTVGGLGGTTGYYSTDFMSGNTLYWNNSNKATDYSCVATFSQNCEVLTQECYEPGGTSMMSKTIVLWVHHAQ